QGRLPPGLLAPPGFSLGSPLGPPQGVRGRGHFGGGSGARVDPPGLAADSRVTGVVSPPADQVPGHVLPIPFSATPTPIFPACERLMQTGQPEGGGGPPGFLRGPGIPTSRRKSIDRLQGLTQRGCRRQPVRVLARYRLAGPQQLT